MNIAYIIKSCLLDAPRILVESIHRYTKHNARELTIPGMRSGWNIYNEDDVNATIEWADILHFLHRTHPDYLLESRPEIYKKKYVVWQLRGRIPARSRHKNLQQCYQWPPNKLIHYAYLGQGWGQFQLHKKLIQYGIDLVPLPNIIPIHDYLYKPLPWHKRKKRLVQICNINFCKHNYRFGKGENELRHALRGRGIRLAVLTNLPKRVCLFRKKKAVLGVEDTLNPLYHRSGLEFACKLRHAS